MKIVQHERTAIERDLQSCTARSARSAANISSLSPRVALSGSLNMFTSMVWTGLRGVSALLKGAMVVTALLGLLSTVARGELVYVSDLGANAVVVKDSSNGNEVARIATARPIGIALNSTTRRGYISASGSGGVYVIDLDANAVIPPAISVGGGPVLSALNEQTDRLYVANYAGGYVSVVNTATNTLITNVSTGSGPFSVAVVKNTNKAYVADSNNVAEVDGLTNTVTRYFLLASANTGDITYASTVNKLFTADADAETVSVINLSTSTVSAVSLGRTPIRGFGPQGVAFDPGTNRVIVSTGDGWLFAIDAATEQIVASVRVANELQRLRISPSTRRIYAPSGTAGTVYIVDADSLATVGTLAGFVNPVYAEVVPSTITFLDFPLHVNNEADGVPLDPELDVKINTVFDHQVPIVNGIPRFYKNDGDGIVTAYTGETGSLTACQNAGLKNCKRVLPGGVVGYKNATGSEFIINGNYHDVYLDYEGHPGFDYHATMVPPTPIFAAADGVAFIPDGDPITSSQTPNAAVNRFNILAIDHGNGYSTWYLHLGNDSTGEDFRLIKCPSDTTEFKITDVQSTQHQIPVTSDCQVAKVGDKGIAGHPHLHFEVRVGLAKDKDGKYNCVPGTCIPVDPYGWTDPDSNHKDPYILPNVRLWN